MSEDFWPSGVSFRTLGFPFPLSSASLASFFLLTHCSVHSRKQIKLSPYSLQDFEGAILETDRDCSIIVETLISLMRFVCIEGALFKDKKVKVWTFSLHSLSSPFPRSLIFPLSSSLPNLNFFWTTLHLVKTIDHSSWNNVLLSILKDNFDVSSAVVEEYQLRRNFRKLSTSSKLVIMEYFCNLCFESEEFK